MDGRKYVIFAGEWANRLAANLEKPKGKQNQVIQR